ncbi:response regulator [Solibacillus isronensis]|uniref:response regulator n=1 Tax=Solibacillus isronensis TaxID=412383 RepID=UPI0020413CB8|nr:response regulator [Solibacillus isronensis]MCM3720804.1 response regulator [Solibacillus isronensis]
MRKKIVHIVVIVGALSNAAILAFMDMPVWLIILMSVIYIVMFEGLLLILEPRLVRAERERNIKAFPFLRELVVAKKATVTLRDGSVLYNATFEGYVHPKDAKTILLYVHKVKTKKEMPTFTEHSIKLINIKSVKKIQ